MRTMTYDLLERMRTPRGGYDAKTLRALGVGWPPKAGWPRRIMGKQFDDALIDGILGRHDKQLVMLGRTKRKYEPFVIENSRLPITAHKDGVLHFDGACYPNPGPSRCAFILRMGADVVQQRFDLGDGTNNTAEYWGIIHGMTAALERDVTHLEVYGDSQLVIRGVGKMKPWKGGKPHLEALKAQAQALVRRFARVELHWVDREQNAEADALAAG